ncbi:MAG: hypothetical protein LUG99_08705 [Lachnospiraceae bacterium]|nr:hypothetical protein [Lachnospiraceae bacterium]
MTKEREALERELSATRTKYYKKQPFYYVSRYEKLKEKYQSDPKPETKQEMEEMKKMIETVCPYGEAVSQWREVKDKMVKCRGALKDNKKEMRIVEDTFSFFCQMESPVQNRYQMESSAQDREASRESYKDKTNEKREDAKYGTETDKSKKVRSSAAIRKTAGAGIGKDTE